MVSSRTAFFSALALCAGVAAAQGLSSGSTSGSISQGTLQPGQPALQAPTTPSATPTPLAATPTPSASTPLPGQSTMPQQLPPLSSSGVAAIAAPPGNVPTRSSTAAEAFSMLDRGGVGYVTRADTDRIPGFMGFDNADTNRDGQLSKEEFANMWRAYSGQ